MAPSLVCPPTDELRELLLGLSDGSRAADLESHLAECPGCAARAAGLPPDDAVVRALRAAQVGIDTPEDRLVDTLRPMLRRLQPAASTAVWEGDQSPTALDLTPQGATSGTLGPYLLREVLGSGGMGVVYRAYDPRLEREIAVKVVRPEVLTRPGAAERFLAEARAAAAVEHDHIVGVFHVETHAGVPCLIMPLLRGRSLETRLRAVGGPLPLAEVLRVGRETAAGLAAAHDKGLVHRDIKPANLWLEDPGGRLKVLDFGLAAARAGGDAAPGVMAGTPGYMAPEQMAGAAVDHRADLYALGCVLFRMATGNAVYPGGSAVSVLIRAATEPPPPAASGNRDLPAPLAELIDRLLARLPADRPASAVAVVDEIRRIETGLVAAQTRRTRRRWAAAAAAGLIAAGGFGAAGVWAWRGDSKPQALPADPPVEMAFDADPVGLKVVVLHDGAERVVELGRDAKLLLPPGDHALRLADPLPGRDLVPDRVIVLPGEPRTVRVSLVGEVARNATHTQPVTGLAVVPAGERFAVLTVGLDRALVAWPAGAKPTFVDLPSPGRCVAASADGRVVATAGGNRVPPADLLIHLWNPATLRPRGEPLAGHTNRVTGLAVSPDGTRVLSAAADGVRLWDAATGTGRVLPDGHDPGGVYAVAVTADGKRAVTGGEDGRVILWDVDGGRPLRKVAAHAGPVRAVAFLPGGFASAGDDGVVRVWDAATFRARDLTPEPGRPGQPVLALAASPDGTRLLSGGNDGLVRLWSAADGSVVYTLAGHGKPVRGVGFTPDGRRAATGGDDNTVRLWQLPF